MTKTASILIVDDDQVTRHLLRKVLTKAGFTVATAKDGVEALKALRAKSYDLLLLDVWMPRMSGLELLAKLRETK
jgi:CheY-like chemotaxis protein